ncbi:MAG: hypothetical protein IJJ81_07475 [Ruminococcus sp.]|nr:hypothetical protein [Ruminococcus sp.]
MQNDKKDLSAILASLDPKLREKIELPGQTPTAEEKTDGSIYSKLEEQAEEISEEMTVEDTPEEEIPEDDGKTASLKEAENQAAAILAFDGSKSSGKEKSPVSYLAVEIIALEFLAFFLFFVTYSSEDFGGLGLIAMLLPPIIGILYRMFRYQLSLKEAFMKCRIHIVISCFFLVCIMLSA